MSAPTHARWQALPLVGLLAFWTFGSVAAGAQTGERAERLANRTGPALQALVDDLRFGASEERPIEAWAATDGAWPLPELAADAPPAPETAGFDLQLLSFAAGETAPAQAWLENLRSHLAPLGPWPYAKTKTILVTPLEGERFATRVRIEWTRSGATDAVLHATFTWDGQEPCRALSGRAETLSLARRTAPLWEERTKGLLAGAGEARDWLSIGGREWSTVLDDAGATAWFGHQGMAVGDVNEDGRPDMYLGMPNGVPNLLLLQQPDGSVRRAPVETSAAWYDDTKGALLVDLDRDGHLDLVAALHHVLVVHRGDGKGRFQVVSALPAPTEAPFYSMAAADVDLDGDLDLYGTRYVRNRYGDSIPIPLEDARNGPSNHLFRNEGSFRFRDVTKASGLDASNQRFSLAASFADYDGDGDPDLYVANDFGRNQLFRNDKGHFQDVAETSGAEDQGAGMGVSWGDVDGDGRQDLLVSNMFSSAGRRIAFQEAFGAGAGLEGVRKHALGNSLLVQSQPGRFANRADDWDLRMGRWAWGSLMLDWNGDGRLDIYAPNGFITGPQKDDL